MEQTDQRLWTGSRFFLLRLIAISLLTIGTIPAKASDPPERAEISEQLKTLITHTKRIDLSAYPAMYADQVAHALQKAEGTMARIESTGEQLNIARLALQVALDKLVADLQKVTIMDLQNLVRSGKLTYRALTQMYLNRIELYDLHTIKLNSVRMLNPHALVEAGNCDLAFASNPDVAKGMFGMPVLVKDNINVTGMPTTAGSVALTDNYAPYDASLITRLKVSGAIIIGKANLTEFANYIATNMTSGFSSLAGQVLNPYRPIRLHGDTITLNPSGSSAGSGAASAAALSAITIGTETSGSILSPAYTNSIVGIKPTVGLISRFGVIPISSSQDIAGPMGRNVTDVAILLTVLAGYDPNDKVTGGIEKAGVTDTDYTLSLKAGNLKGKRIGLVGIPSENNAAYKPFQQVLQVLRDAGAEIITKPDGSALTYYNPDNPDINPRPPSSIVFDYDFAKDLQAYLETLSADYPIKTMKHIVDFNNAYMKNDSAAFRYGQAILERCSELDLEAKKEQYLADRQQDILYARDHGIDYLLKEYDLDCIVATSNTGSTTGIAAKAGYPTVSIPLAYQGGTRHPINLHFTGTAFSEARLIEMAYTVEQATGFRIPPGLADKSSLGAILRDTQDNAQAWDVYHNNFSIQMDIDKIESELRTIIRRGR